MFALCDLALYLFPLICGVDFKLFGIGMCSNSVASPIHRHFVAKLAYCLLFCFSVCLVAALFVAVYALAICVQFPAG